jgi:phage gp36-like protein
MRFLAAPTEDFIKLERTALTEDVAAGTNVSLPVQNSDGFSEDNYIVIGHEGSELAELQQVNQAVSAAGSVRVATLKFNHTKGESVTRYRYNQRKFYGATTAGGVYTELTGDGSPKDMQVDDPQGTVLEYSGNTYTYFKATYYNSTLLEETDAADSEAVLADESLRYTSLWAIRKHAGLAGIPFYSDIRLETKRKQAENEINSVLSARYVLPLTEIPPLLGQICELLAAGYIDYEEFGSEGQGAKWLGEARALLKALRTGTQLLIGLDGAELTRQSKTDTLDGYPNASDTDDAQFSMSDRF